MKMELLPIIISKPKENIKEYPKFSPYTNNGGTTISIAGNDFCVIAADTRLSEGYSISSRNVSKIIKLTNKCILASCGMQADIATLHKTLQIRLQMYKHQNGKDMNTTAIAQLLSNLLYYRRFFPYYTFNVLGGIDEKGEGCTFSYDAVGSFQRTLYSSSGTGQQLIQPLLDNQIAHQHQTKITENWSKVETVEELIKDAFNSATERDIYTGDYVQMFTVTKEGIKETKFELRHD